MPAALAHTARTATSLLVRGALLLVLIEGTASLVGFALGLAGGLPPERERLHMRFDPDLGWTSDPDTRLENFYGPGRHLTINSQGARATHAYAAAPPAGRRRALCAGDAFTLGPGVGDGATWCAQLERIEPRYKNFKVQHGEDDVEVHIERNG